ncbi:MAG TPA: hypothetical protein VE954_42515 [Oligoflexus sp.]|uniref:hypothetical protein n=1 Tax=Oligoflexus sp. TaxID=1971216 RepID=UPI002D5E298D|nr:hypothetical protein [Oligoflexus sp.]HYX39811.1 hypothetical protein [Oligoflexus sp.]HYX39816.1 hypothetical protein [Oligoflexus sp.]
MIKIFCFVVVSLVSVVAFAGGIIGGGGTGLVKEDNISSMAFSIDSLSKVYVNSDDFRRTQARLSVANAGSVPFLIDGESIQVKSWRKSVVDVNVSKEFLPELAN